MRALLRFVGTVLLVVAVVVLAIFAIQNTQSVTANFAGQTFSAALWWLVIGAAVLGFVLASVLVTPGWISAGWRGRMLRRTTQQRETELQSLRQQHEQTLAEHERLLAEHRQLVAERDRMPAAPTAVQPVASGVATSATAEPMEQPATTTTVYPQNEAPMVGHSTMGGPLPQQPQRRQEEWSPNGPAVPTA